MEKRDYYEVLGVSRQADTEEIRQAYRRQAMRHHPDRNPGDRQAEERFKEVREAFGVLSEQAKRRAYDQFGHAGAAVGSQAGHAAGRQDIGGLFNHLFNDVFTQGGGAAAGAQADGWAGSDLIYDVELDLREAAFGRKVDLRFQKLCACESCRGSGSLGKTPLRPCSSCSGTGQVRTQQGFFSIQQTCPGCRGSGQTISDPCPQCRGEGRRRRASQFEVQIPAGVDDGDQVRLTGKGEAGERGAPAGDLYVRVHVRRHPFFVRDGANLLCRVPVSIVRACLGGEVEVPTLKGKVMLKVPPGTQSGQELRLRGQGVPSRRSQGRRGDLLCHIQVETPVRLTKRQRELLEELNREMSEGVGHRHMPIMDSWVQGMKKFLKDLRGH